MYIFDLDNTIADSFSDTLYGAFEVWLAKNRPERIAICTNQGGVGLRYWMTPRPFEGYKGFGEFTQYPLEEQVRLRLKAIKEQIEIIHNVYVETFVCFAYQTKKGQWSPTPPGQEDNPEWSQEWRKPNPGMLLAAAASANVNPSECIYVGDRDTDLEAAANAGMQYVHYEDLLAIDITIRYPKSMVVDWLKPEDRINLNVAASFARFEALMQEKAKWHLVGKVTCVPSSDLESAVEIGPEPECKMVINGPKFADSISNMTLYPDWLVYESPQDHLECLWDTPYRPTQGLLMENYNLSPREAGELLKRYENG